jgi:hypothetical protein
LTQLTQANVALSVDIPKRQIVIRKNTYLLAKTVVTSQMMTALEQ